MTLLSSPAREICAKIVYYGPGLSGKTTTLRHIYASIRPTHRGEMVSLATQGDRTLFFDFLPVRVEHVGDATVRLALYTVPGQVFYNATRKLVLQNADGVVFVADSQPAAMDSNLESLENLQKNLHEMGLDPDQVPLVVQYNKRDLKDVLPVAELRKSLNPHNAPDFETVANRGEKILDALRAITRSVIGSLREKGVVLAKPRPPAQVPMLESQTGPDLSSQLAEVAASAPEEAGLLAVLLPGHHLADAEQIESDFRRGHHLESVVRGMATLRCCLRDLGGPKVSEVESALLAGLTGPDYARLLRIERDAQPTRDDAAFVLLMLGLAGDRMRD